MQAAPANDVELLLQQHHRSKRAEQRATALARAIYKPLAPIASRHMAPLLLARASFLNARESIQFYELFNICSPWPWR